MGKSRSAPPSGTTTKGGINLPNNPPPKPQQAGSIKKQSADASDKGTGKG